MNNENTPCVTMPEGQWDSIAAVADWLGFKFPFIDDVPGSMNVKLISDFARAIKHGDEGVMVDDFEDRWPNIK